MNKIPSRFTVLYTIIFIIIIAIVCGTAAVFVSRSARPGADLRKADPSPQSLAKNFAAYTDIGQIRTGTAAADGRGATVVVEPWFSYEDGDTAFFEELAGKKRKIRSLIIAYFASRSVSELRTAGEAAVKADLLSAINGELTLGSVYAVYFETYLFIE
ncbi:flagellar basal body-associated FliL family protein [Treponema brennaborense]|uniref:Flagellar protein FliL n=1 Tax=Treponema brennaborense (strain DSM 12168 / CIP 105900 / DD5/3) TaxID=906968 RepID=F4LPF3_TREBD|nr:flagellar basal body-associated FliL family protein [Treponema brennaborense]AEE15964.1 flagellar basal body-associated protein FliL [Treponema brennaborense DSM 12168]